MGRIRLVVVFLLLAACVRAPESGRRLGTVEFASSCAENAQDRIRDGVALLHQGMQPDAERSFLAATALDAKCAMAQWGIAMAQIRPLSAAEPTAAALGKAAGALAKARALAPPTERERAYVDVAAALFEGWDRTDQATRFAAWEQAAERLYRDDPADIDAAAFHAVARLATIPPGDRALSRREEILAILTPLREQYPQHPGVAYALVHACDDRELAERALATARAYREIAPDLHGVLHATAHIFTRLGRWDDALDANVRSLSTLRRVNIGGATWSRYAHAADWLMYAYMQTGWDMRAVGLRRQIARVERFEENFESAYALAALPVRAPLECRDWAGAAKVTPAGQADFPWDRYPAARAVTWFARGIGAARSGDPATARAAAANLATLHAALLPGEPYWAGRVEAQRLAVEAWLVFEAGTEQRTAIEQMRAAAEMEDATEMNSVAPETVLPLRELLGEMLRDAGDDQAALSEFETSLARRPGRFFATYNAGRAAQKAGNDDAARAHYGKLMELVEASHAQRPELETAKAFLRMNPAPAHER